MTAINPSPFVRSDVASAIRLASAKSGIDADFLFRQAEIESGFDPNAKASTSSAEGLYQFIEQTWLQTVKRHGGEHGLGWAADSISERGGRFSAGADEAAVLGLRSDPRAAAAMAAAFAVDNQSHLERSLGRPATGTDLYLAHFLGAGGAARFLRSHGEAPERPAAHVLPDAARANRPVFFTKAGRPRSLDEVYQSFAGKLGTAAGTQGRPPATDTAYAPEVESALSATRAWLEHRAASQQHGPPVSPASARLLYLTLTTAGI